METAKGLTKDNVGEGEYVCHRCHIIYVVYGSSCCCDICGRRLRFANSKRLKELEVIWTRREHRKGLNPDFAYQRRTITDKLLGRPAID